MTLVIAHRGASHAELENTLAAFRAARALGADAVELDVHAAADGEPIVHHDPIVDGLAISETSMARLRRVRLANGEPPPTLRDALELLDGLLVFVEAKGLPAAHDGRLLEVLAAAADRGRVHAFDHRIVRRLKDARPALTCGVLSCSYPVQPLAAVADAGAVALWQQDAMVDADLVRAAHERGVAVYAWTVDDPQRMRELIGWDIDGICTNRPDVAREVVG